jgi:Tfp pilus assembly protein PilO
MKIFTWKELRCECLNLVMDKRQRYLLMAGAILILLGLAFLSLPYFEGIQGGQTDIAVQRKRVEKYRQTVQQRGEIETRLAYLKKSLDRAETGLLTGKTEALAAADIQNILNEIALGSGVEIRSLQVLKSQKKDSDPYVGVPLQFNISTTIRQLKDILYKIEASPKYFLTVEKIGISVAGAGSPGQIRCDVTVSGIMKNVKE